MGLLEGDGRASLDDVVRMARGCRQPKVRLVTQMLGLEALFGDVAALERDADDFERIVAALTREERENPLALRDAAGRLRRGEIERSSGAPLASIDRLLEIYANLPRTRLDGPAP